MAGFELSTEVTRRGATSLEGPLTSSTGQRTATPTAGVVTSGQMVPWILPRNAGTPESLSFPGSETISWDGGKRVAQDGCQHELRDDRHATESSSLVGSAGSSVVAERTALATRVLVRQRLVKGIRKVAQRSSAN
jgi:hypothetical protein